MIGRAPPGWLFPEGAVAAPADESGAFLDRCDDEDRRLLALRYGFGLDLGAAAWVLGLDPGLAHWRLRSAFTQWDGASAPAALERGVAAQLTRDGEPGPDARRAAERLPDAARARLDAELADRRGAAAANDRRPGLGIGSLALILLAAGAFMVYGAYHDVDPLMRGRRDIRLGEYAAARAAFDELGALPEARLWTAISWLAEGEFDKAFEVLHEPEVRKRLGLFRPYDEPVEPLEIDAESRALLPRGLMTIPTPTFVYEPSPEGEITLLWSAADDPSRTRTVRIPVPDTRGGPPLARVEFPSDRAPLQPGVYQWWIPGDELHPASFTLLGPEQRLEVRDHVMRTLNYEIPTAARTFLRAHYYLRNQLVMQAGEHFADLALEFTKARYPRLMLAEVSAALGVDPSAFLR